MGGHGSGRLAWPTLRASTLLLDLFGCRVVDVSLSALDELDSKLIKLLEVVARVGDLERLETKPSNGLKNTREVLLFLGFRVGVIVTEVAEAPLKRA